MKQRPNYEFTPEPLLGCSDYDCSLECYHCGANFNGNEQGVYHYDDMECPCNTCSDPERKQVLNSKCFCCMECESNYLKSLDL